jgi:hypothetical protein
MTTAVSQTLRSGGGAGNDVDTSNVQANGSAGSAGDMFTTLADPTSLF